MKEKTLEELLDRSSLLEKERTELYSFINEIQHRIYGIQAVLLSLMESSTGDDDNGIEYITFRCATGVALDSIDAVVEKLEKGIILS
jgi:hypothetical protein